MIESKELSKLNKKLAKVGEALVKAAMEVPDEVTKELALGANKIRNAIIESMKKEKKTGRLYKATKSGLKHQASAPGEAPAVDSGELISRIIFDIGDMKVEIGAEAGAPYDIFLEEGTDKMEARSWLAPAVEKHQQAIVDAVGEGVFEVIKNPFEGKL